MTDAISFIRLSPGATFGEELDKRRQRRFDVAGVDVVDAKQKVLPEIKKKSLANVSSHKGRKREKVQERKRVKA
jgi:hypothetical protein